MGLASNVIVSHLYPGLQDIVRPNIPRHPRELPQEASEALGRLDLLPQERNLVVFNRNSAFGTVIIPTACCRGHLVVVRFPSMEHETGLPSKRTAFPIDLPLEEVNSDFSVFGFFLSSFRVL